MRIFHIDREQWGEIVDSLLRNKTRALLTAFGIFWGIFMLLLLMGAGKGMEIMLTSNFSGFASNAGIISDNLTTKPYMGFRKGRRWHLVVEDAQRIRHAVPEVEVVTPSVARWGVTAYRGTKTCDVTICGQYPDYDLVDDPLLSSGRGINLVDVVQCRKVCVIGKRICEDLFTPDESPCGQTICLDGIYYTVVGVSGKDDGGMSLNGRASTTIRFPYTTMQRAYNIGSQVDMICLTARKGYTMSHVQKKVAQVVKKLHKIHPDDSQAVVVINTEAMFSIVDELFGGISMLVWMIGVGTLLSGVIGVSNIMVVTVKERTTEIGIRRAIGATPMDILCMIMSESVVLTLLAGMSGITLAVFLLQMVDHMLGLTGDGGAFQVSFGTAVSAVLTLSVLGVLAGLAPVYRALHIKPVDAMREE